jgi:hypothetical protein
MASSVSAPFRLSVARCPFCYTSADIPKIVDLAPDLVLGFSDLQADIVSIPAACRGASCGRTQYPEIPTIRSCSPRR